MEPLLGIPVGLALSTAAGLRVFVPLLLTGLAARLGYLTLTPSMRWIGSDAALVVEQLLRRKDREDSGDERDADYEHERDERNLRP